MKLKSGDMLVMDVRYGAMTLQIIGRNDVPRVEKEGRGWRDGATVLLKGADVAEFLDVICGSCGGCEIGDSGLYMELTYDDLMGRNILVLSAEGVSAQLTWAERTLLLYAVRNIAWRLFT